MAELNTTSRYQSIVAGISGLLLALFAFDGWTCTCLRSTVEENFEVADAVFSGKVLQIEEASKDGENQWDEIFSPLHEIEIELELDETWKGESVSKISVMTYRDGDMCGYTFSVGDTYLVFAYAEEAQNEDEEEVFSYLSTNRCTHNQILNPESTETKAILEELDELNTKAAGESDDGSSNESEVAEDS
ncbi:MAG: hypothetical protein OXG24_00630 [Gammaproteobacteria bacterium]|nr:hypothetical protein [Gammaproteobacteria bacterium]